MDDIIKQCIDMDTWKHSWHNKLKTLDDYKKAEAVILDKICSRKAELETLYEGLRSVKLTTER